MHIAFLTPEYPHERATRSGGLGTSIKNLALSLVDRGVAVTIFLAYQKFNETLTEDGIVIHFIGKKKYPIANWFFYKRYLSHYVNRVVDLEGIDLIEAPDWTGITAFMSIDVPLVVRIHGSDAYFCNLEHRKQKKKNFLLEKKNLFKADAVVSVSDYAAQVSKDVFNYTKPINIIHNSIDCVKFQPLPIAVRANSILYFGAVIRKKGVLDLAYAFNLVVEKNPFATLTVIGKDVVDYKTGSSTVGLMKSILTNDAIERVSFIDEVPYGAVKEYIACSQVVCLPSYAEAFPMTWLETLAMEKALVSSDIGWSRELMVSGETGFTVHPSDHDQMASYILELLYDNEKAEACGKAGREIVLELFSTGVIVQKNMDFYSKVLSK